MASTTGVTALISSNDSDDTKDLYHMLNTSTAPVGCTLNYETANDGQSGNLTPFGSTAPISAATITGIRSWTVGFTARYPQALAEMGDGGLVTFASGYVGKVKSFNLNLTCTEIDTTGMASTTPTARDFVPGLISWSGSYVTDIDDTTAHAPPGTSGSATFRLNEDTADNTLAGTIRVTSVAPNMQQNQLNTATVNFVGSGNLTSAGTNTLFPAGALTKPDITDILLQVDAEGSSDVDFDGAAFWTSLGISVAIGSPIEVSATLRGTGALVLGE